MIELRNPEFEHLSTDVTPTTRPEHLAARRIAFGFAIVPLSSSRERAHIWLILMYRITSGILRIMT
jgi:hypothetical protein